MKLQHPTHGEVVDIDSPGRIETLLARGYTPLEDTPAKKKPSRTARILPVDPPAEPTE